MSRQLDMFAVNSYHNTVTLKGKALESEEDRARRQDDKVLKVFQSSKYQSFTPYDVYLALGQQVRKESIQRSITNLTKAGKLRVTGERRKGEFHVETNCWILA